MSDRDGWVDRSSREFLLSARLDDDDDDDKRTDLIMLHIYKHFHVDGSHGVKINLTNNGL